MTDDTRRVRVWRFASAPSEFQGRFREGRDDDWIVHAAESELTFIGPTLLGWRRIYPVEAVSLEDGSTLLWGAPRKALASIAQLSGVAGEAPSGVERRTAPRLQVEFPLQYETHSEPRRAGEGHTIDMSTTGIAFTAESLLPTNVTVRLFVRWPVALEGDVAVELHATGRVVRAEGRKAAMQVEETKFQVSNS